MPINPNALSGSAPEPEPEKAEAAEEQPAKRTRRTKAQLIADAVVPGDRDKVEIKDAGTGAKIERDWVVAVEMVRDGKAEWANKEHKYSALKYEQQKASGAFAQPEVQQGEPVSDAEKIAKSANVPPDAEVGDEVRVGSDTYRVGHGGVLTTGAISVDGELVQPKRRWQRELGAGVEGPWQAVTLTQAPSEKPETNGKGEETPVASGLAKGAFADAAVTVDRVREPADIDRVSETMWKVGTGILEKIGLPDYSSLQIGPVSASRMVVDDGRRTKVTIGSREASIPTAVLEVFQEACDVTEFIARYQRGELVSFLESTGALKQPVS